MKRAVMGFLFGLVVGIIALHWSYRAAPWLPEAVRFFGVLGGVPGLWALLLWAWDVEAARAAVERSNREVTR